MELLTDNHYEKILDLFDSVEMKIRIISPFFINATCRKTCTGCE